MDGPRPSGRVNWTDYCSWTDDQRWEIIDGHPYAMTAPRVSHQSVVGEMYVLLHAHFKSRPCIVCERSQIKETHVEGPPDLAVEVLSPSTQRHDRIRKLRLYAAAGIKEY